MVDGRGVVDISTARYLLCDKGFVPYNVQSQWYISDYTSECSVSHIDVYGLVSLQSHGNMVY